MAHHICQLHQLHMKKVLRRPGAEQCGSRSDRHQRIADQRGAVGKKASDSLVMGVKKWKDMERYGKIWKDMETGWCFGLFLFSIQLGIIIPTDGVIFLRGVGIPPTRKYTGNISEYMEIYIYIYVFF